MSRNHQVVRQWALLRMLEQARGGLTVAELERGATGECSRRTLYRDLEALQEAGFPLVDEGGRWRVLQAAQSAWSVPLQPTELLALALAEEMFAPARGTWIGSPLRDLGARLEALLTPNGRRYLDQLRSTAVATLFAPGRYDERAEGLDAVGQAIVTEQVLRFRYTKPGGLPEVREVEPYATWYHGGLLYLVARCRRARAVRTFAMNRIDAPEILDEVFDPDPDFDAVIFAQQGFGVYHGPSYCFVVELSSAVAHLARERLFHRSQDVEELARGRVRLRMTASGLPEVAAWVASLGGEAVPVEPPELVDAVRALHRRGLAVLGEVP